MRSPRVNKSLSRLLAVAFMTAVLMPFLASPAEGCSCAMPTDLNQWVDESEAVFVGTLVDRRDTPDFQAVYVFEVEEWVKGDAGEMIEVMSGQGGGDCGFEFWDADQRIGAALYVEGGELHGGLCSQVDADVLLAAVRGLTPSSTGIPRIMAATGWDSPRLTLLDAAGGHITDLSPPIELPEGTGTQHLETCPEGALVVQATSAELMVWDTTTFEVVATHDLAGAGAGWVADVACREPDASSIWVLVSSDLDSKLVEVVPERTTLLELPGSGGRIGTDFVVSQVDSEGDLTWVDVETGEETRLTTTPPSELRSLSVAPHPLESRIAILENVFDESEPTRATLTVLDGPGEDPRRFDLPWEAYSPVWIDDTRVLVSGYDWEVSEQPSGVVVDVSTGDISTIDGFGGNMVVADGDELFGVSGGSLLTADLGAGSVGTLVTLPTQSAGPLVLLDGDDAVEVAVPTTSGETGPTVPPLVAPELEETSPAGVPTRQWIAGGAVAVFLGVLAWLALRRPRPSTPS